ncbi:MAG: hypothetical protein JO352_16745 [Chloroflexi bacterium]|nr:hypothetical protein [Chloroflexota bacterium]MBV9602067.1 hypothetical protein [Chloroflexota bacterium]
MPSSPPPDRFQREIDDIIRLAERRLEHQSFGYRVRRSTRRLGSAFSGIHIGLPPAEVLGGWAMALLLIGWLMTLPIVNGVLLARVLAQPVFVVGIVLLVLAIISSLTRGRSSRASSSGGMWRGERVSYGSPYPESWLGKLRKMFRGDR